MAISNIVNEIIQKRNSKLPAIEQKRQEMLEICKALDQYDDLKSQIVDADGNALEGKYKYLTDKNPEMVIKLNALDTAECRKKIDAALEECDIAYKRFSRESINISVVGKARIGKSQFLKGISNLDDKVIPAFAETDCTGAVSIIENHPGTALEAHFTFKTEEQIIAEVQTYLDKIVPAEKGRIVLRTMSQIGDKSLVEQVEARLIPGREENGLREYLYKYVEHYEEWAPLVRKRTLVISDADEIQTYVAQNDGNKEDSLRRYFYKFLAVDTCQIYCTFDYQEAGKITLIDTVGLGDNSLGIEENLLEVVNDKSDAVVFIHLPYSPAGGYVDKEVSKAYGLIETNSRGRDLNKWLFWLINEAPGHPKTPNDRARCEAAVKKLESKGWHGAMTKIVNIIDQNQVREEFLIPMLNLLMANLDDIDATYTTDLTKALDAVRKEYNSFCASAKKVMDSQINNAASLQPQIYKSVSKMQERLTASLRKLAKAEKEKRNVPCAILKKRIQSILEDMREGEIVPSRDQLLQELSYEMPPVLYTKYCNQIRNEVAQRFANVDGSLNELVAEVKNSVAYILYCDDGCRLAKVLALPTGEEPYVWMREFEQTVLNEKDYPILTSAFRNVYNFNFSVNGFLTYEVRACLDLIDPDLTDTPMLLGKTDVQTADNINFWLQKNLLDVVDELEENLHDLFRNPHRAFFAIIKEFSDLVVYAEDVEYEWNRLFADNYSIIWAEEYKNMAVAATAFGEWADMLNHMLELNSKAGSLPNI